MAMSAPRSSVFTFESTVHSSHVLRLLDEQRCRDMLCDVTVLVEGQSFRAHRSVLASCCEYFTHKISSLTQHGAVITLPQEVTAAGFEPLLKFAYTSKLLFGKDNALDIRNSASVLGFRDLDEACFDFLLPKFLSSGKDSARLRKETCCETKCGGRLLKEDRGVISDDVSLDEKEEKLVADSSSQQEVAWLCNRSVNSKMGSQNNAGTLTPERANEQFMQCPKYRRQLACEKETCVTDKSLTNPVTAIKDDSDLSRLPCSSSANSKNESGVEFPGNSTLIHTRQIKGGSDNPLKTETPDKKAEGVFGGGKVDVVEKETNEMQEKRREKERDVDMKECSGFSDRFNVKTVSSGSSTGSSGLILHRCSLKTFGESPAITGSVGRERFDIDVAEDKKTRDSVVPVSIHRKSEDLAEAEWKRVDVEVDRGKGGQTGSMDRVATNNARERSTMEREVAEHLVKRLGSDVGFSQLSFQDSDAGSSSDTGSGRAPSTSSDWLNYSVSLNSTNTSCSYYQDLDQSKCVWKGAELSECEGASQSGVSSLNSGEDGDTETETDSESYRRERARQVQLPFSVDWIVDLSRNDFQQLLKQQVFTREQLEFVHDMRRRSKNRLAAQRCRKRKLDCIYNLQCEINKLKTEREKLIMERSQLGQMKLKTCHSVSALCQRVCSEANLQPEQLQVLAKYTSPDCPLSSFFPHIDALLSQPGLSLQPQSLLLASSVGLDEYMASEEASSSSSRDTISGDGQH